jgi:hypothetical protein
MHRMRPALVLLVALALVAACSSGSKPGSTTTTTAATTTTTLTPAQQAAQPVLDAGMLTTAELPAGFTDTGMNGRSQTDAIIAEEKACEPFRDLTDHGVATRLSHQFNQGTTVTALDQVDVYLDDATATSRIELTQDPRIIDCLTARYGYPFTKGKAQLPKGAKFTRVDVSPLAITPAGTDTTGFRVTAHFAVSADGTTRDRKVVTNLVFLQVGRALVLLQVTGADAAGFAEIETTAIPAIAQRVQAALGG